MTAADPFGFFGNAEKGQGGLTIIGSEYLIGCKQLFAKFDHMGWN